VDVEIRRRILDAIRENFPDRPVEDLADEAPLADTLGLNSMQVVDLVMALEEQFGIQVPDGELGKLTSLKACGAFVEQAVRAAGPA
jgi:acyl carrier protein